MDVLCGMQWSDKRINPFYALSSANWKRNHLGNEHDLRRGKGSKESNIGVFGEGRGVPLFAKKGSSQFPILPPPIMKKYRAVVEYDGTNYHGWQLQKDLPTIQETIELALVRILGTPTRVHGAGRTDAGVHAIGQVAHFSADWRHSTEELRKGCNALLPGDIVLRSLEPSNDDFHARHSAQSKLYEYQIFNQPIREPLQRLYTWHIPYPLQLRLMDRATSYLLGSHDFAAFGSPTDGSPSTVREILEAEWETTDSHGIVRFTIRGTGFLRYMVRTIVGTLVMVGKGKITPGQFNEILVSCDRSLSGPTAPPQGLRLVSVDYESAVI